MEKIKIKNEFSLGLIWIIGWMFTIGFLGLSFWNGVLALVTWPYLLGQYFSI